MRFPLSSLRERCLATLVYFDLFDYPLTLKELRQYFLGEQPSLETIQEFLDQHQNLIHSQHGYYFLKGREHILLTREEREKVSQKYWKKVRFFLPFIQFVPFVSMVGVCNTLAFDNASKESDIDLFIVAKKGRLFFVRFLTVMLFTFLGVRRHGNKIAGRFCLSFYADETALDLQLIQNDEDDIYLPYWVLTMRPIYGQKIYKNFVDANSWISKYFARTLQLDHDFGNYNFLHFLRRLKEILWRGKIGDKIEEILKKIQIKRHKQHLSRLPSEASIVVNDHMLKFHNIDRRKDIAKRFEQKLKEVI